MKKVSKFKSAIFDSLLTIPKLNLPVDLELICQEHNIILLSYSDAMKRFNCSIIDLMNKGGSKYSFVIADTYKGNIMYQIYYNDTDINIMTSNMFRFSIAHELGHIFLGHLKNDKTIIARYGLHPMTYKKYEREADEFAAFLLSPHVVLNMLGIDQDWNIESLCKISKSATKLRFSTYLEWKNKNAHPFMESYDLFLLELFKDYYSLMICPQCGHQHSIKDSYCNICGRKTPNNKNLTFFKLYERKLQNMEYKEISTNEFDQVDECLVCGNEVNREESSFCKICGKPIINKCSLHGDFDQSYNGSYYHCDTILPGDARFCDMCGAESSFFQAGLLPTWQEEKEQLEMEMEMEFNFFDDSSPEDDNRDLVPF